MYSEQNYSKTSFQTKGEKNGKGLFGYRLETLKQSKEEVGKLARERERDLISEDQLVLLLFESIERHLL